MELKLLVLLTRRGGGRVLESERITPSNVAQIGETVEVNKHEGRTGTHDRMIIILLSFAYVEKGALE